MFAQGIRGWSSAFRSAQMSASPRWVRSTATSSTTRRTPIRRDAAPTAALRWYACSTVPRSVTVPSRTMHSMRSSGTSASHCRAQRTARAIEVSSRSARSGGWTTRSFATALTPATPAAIPPAVTSF